jgi:hypothetical protein
MNPGVSPFREILGRLQLLILLIAGQAQHRQTDQEYCFGWSQNLSNVLHQR